MKDKFTRAQIDIAPKNRSNVNERSVFKWNLNHNMNHEKRFTEEKIIKMLQEAACGLTVQA